MDKAPLLSVAGCEAVSPVASRSRRRTDGTCAPSAALSARPRRGGNRVVKIGQRFPSQRLMHDAFKGPDHAVVFRCDKREGVTQVVCPTGAADTMEASAVSGMSKLMTCEMPSTSRPRAAMSVATMI